MLKKLCCIFMLVVLVACQQADINVEQGSYIYKGDDISVPVSYTHLDVYKRQLPDCLYS